MSSNTTIIADFHSLSQEELVEEYERLSNFYKQLKQSHEQDLQHIHELKRSLQTSTNAETYLSAELESIGSVHKDDIDKNNQKHILVVEELKQTNAGMRQSNAALEAACEDLRRNIDELKEKLESAALNNQSLDLKANDTLPSEREMFLEKANAELITIVDEYKEKLSSLTIQSSDSKSQIEMMKEKIECLEDNLQSKKQEIYEVQRILETTQEKVIELSSELALFKTAPDNPNKKGNSLFAEVDDQRQKMISMLTAQNKHYQQMKKLHVQNEIEIRRLKRENSAMCQEMKACSALFLKADSNFKEILNATIAESTEENEKLLKQLNWTEKKLIELAADKGIKWIESMLSFCKSETQELKSQLYNCRMQKRMVDERLWKIEQDMAKWRFESLKSRYIIIDRESLLEEHKIQFQTYDMLEQQIHIDEYALENAKPHVGFATTNDDNGDCVIENDKSNQIQCNINEIKANTMAKTIMEEPTSCLSTINGEKEENETLKEDNNETVILERDDGVDGVIDKQQIGSNENEIAHESNDNDNKENNTDTANAKGSKLVFRDIVFTPKQKSRTEALNPNLRNKNLFGDDSETSTPAPEPAQRTKSKVIVKRIVVPSKNIKISKD